MENEEHQKVELYIPRKCSVTHRLIESGDKSSIQFNVCVLGKDGVMIRGIVLFYCVQILFPATFPLCFLLFVCHNFFSFFVLHIRFALSGE